MAMHPAAWRGVWRKTAGEREIWTVFLQRITWRSGRRAESDDTQVSARAWLTDDGDRTVCLSTEHKH